MPFSPKAPTVSSRLEERLANKNVALGEKKLKTPTQKRQMKKLSKQHTSYELLEKFNKPKYETWKNRCIEERTRLGPGNSPQMNTLFRFWSMNLRKFYSKPMYRDFKKFASQDAKAGSTYGVQCLFRYYSYGLEQKFNSELFDDFQLMVLERQQKGDLYGLEKLVALLSYSQSLANEKPSLHPVIKRLVKEHPLESFSKESEVDVLN